MTRRGSFSVNAANQRSTRSIHDEPVGVMCQLTSVLLTDEVTDTARCRAGVCCDTRRTDEMTIFALMHREALYAIAAQTFVVDAASGREPTVGSR